MNNYYQRILKVLSFIENNLDEKHSLEDLAAIACYSSFHFHRLFRAYTGENVYNFQRRLLLERAANQLLHSDRQITDIALASGYDNQASFNKAFNQLFGHAPGKVRSQHLEAVVNTVAVHSGQLDLMEGINKMKVNIQTIDDIPVLAVRKQGAYKEAASEAWQALMSFCYGNKLMTPTAKSFGISHDNPDITQTELIRYDACLFLGDKGQEKPLELTANIVRDTIKGGKYAIFRHSGSYENLPASYNYIFNVWLQQSEYELRESYCFEQYLNRDPRRTKPENLKTDIFVPLT